MIKTDSSYADNTRTYVLKLWLEVDAAGDETVAWRGQLTNVLTRKVTHVQTMEALITFLEAELSALRHHNRD
ncbi:MAG: hypothetical protein KC415_00435 [Anaerolineales bacterium]|nr:hypothetical protein [Anaerolineales bacterium]MCB9434488.1 hypothetical protein [Ardenticatenaceae bacterium]